MDLNIVISEKVSYIQNNVLNYNLQLHKSQLFHLLHCSSCRPAYTYGFYFFRCFYRNLDYIRITKILTLPPQPFSKKMCIHIACCIIVTYGIDIMFLQNEPKRISQIHEFFQLFNNPHTATRHRCTRNGNGWHWIHSMLCIVGLSSSILQSISLFTLLHIIQSSSEIWYLQQQTP